MVDNLSKEKRSILPKDTKPELLVRKMLTAMGYRYRLHRKDIPGCPDIAFIGRKKPKRNSAATSEHVSKCNMIQFIDIFIHASLQNHYLLNWKDTKNKDKLERFVLMGNIKSS